MKKKLSWQFGATIPIILFFASCVKPVECTESPATVKVFATGLNNPRGLKFGPDKYLYVAEGGIGGTNSTVGQCLQVVPPVGPWKGSTTGGRISKISPGGVRTTVTDNLPSSTNSFGDITGVSDVAFIGNALYALLDGAGCSHGVPSIPNGIVKVAADGKWEVVANLSAFYQSHPVKNPEPGDFEPDGGPYSMIYANNNFYVVEPNHGALDKVSSSGAISRVIDISAQYGHIVPTSIAYYDGNFYVGNLNTFPIVDGSSNVYKVTPTGQMQVWATGFTTILGLTFDDKGRLYVLENTIGAPFPTPGKGRIVRVSSTGAKKIIAEGLTLPTGITFGPDKMLYVSAVGFGPTATGGGQVLQIDARNCDCDDLKAVTKN